jgi:hypothetical protein
MLNNSGGNTLSIEFVDKKVLIDGEQLKLISGEVHYWRLERQYWEPILERLLEAGINMVATYVPWRIHMPERGHVNFGKSENDPLNLRGFLELAKRMGLRVFLRPGPLIVSEMKCGGLPDYLFEDESILVRNAKGEIPKGGFAPMGTVSYLNPRYLEHCKQWITTVHEVVSDYYHQNGGPISMLQLDNEVSYVCHDGMFTSDYNEAIVGKGGYYHSWLRKKYGSIPPYKPTPHNILDIEPPRELGNDYETNTAYYLDWVEMREDMMAEYLSALRRMWEDLGVRDMIYTTNYNPHNVISVPTNWAKMETATGGITGYDFYRRPYMSFHGWSRMALICAYSETATKVPWSPEFMSGIWGEDFGDGFGAVPAEHLEFMSLCAFAFGLKGMNYYMFAEREEWSFCPVNQFGQKRYSFEALKKVVQLANEVEFSNYTPKREIAILFHRPYGWFHYIEDEFPAADWDIKLGKSSLDGDVNGIGYQDFEQIFNRLLQIGFLPKIIDADLNPQELCEYPIIFVPSQVRMEKSVVNVLKEYAKSGGRVIWSPEPPSKDILGNPYDTPITWGESLGKRLPVEKAGTESIESLKILADVIGFKPSIQSDDRFVLPVILQSPNDSLLFVMNINPRAKRVCITFSRNISSLTDILSNESFKVKEGSLLLEVDAKMCRVFRINL